MFAKNKVNILGSVPCESRQARKHLVQTTSPLLLPYLHQSVPLLVFNKLPLLTVNVRHIFPKSNALAEQASGSFSRTILLESLILNIYSRCYLELYINTMICLHGYLTTAQVSSAPLQEKTRSLVPAGLTSSRLSNSISSQNDSLNFLHQISGII